MLQRACGDRQFLTMSGPPRTSFRVAVMHLEFLFSVGFCIHRRARVSWLIDVGVLPQVISEVAKNDQVVIHGHGVGPRMYELPTQFMMLTSCLALEPAELGA